MWGIVVIFINYDGNHGQIRNEPGEGGEEELRRAVF